MMALNQKLKPYNRKCLDGGYDNLLRTLPLFTAVPYHIGPGSEREHLMFGLL